MRFLLDENIQKPDDTFNMDYVNLKDILPLGTPDRTILKYARGMNLVVVTKDIRMALNAVIMNQDIVFIDQNENYIHIRAR